MARYRVDVGEADFGTAETEDGLVVRAKITDPLTGDIFDLIFDEARFVAFADAFKMVADDILDEQRQKGVAPKPDPI
jgi:hypothetical protein